MTKTGEAGETSKDYLGMSDEDFLNINSPASSAEVVVEEPAAAEAVVEGEPIVEGKQEDTKDVGPVVADAAVVEPGEDGVIPDPDKPAPTPEELAAEAAKVEADETAKNAADPNGSKPEDGAVADAKDEKDKPAAAAEPVDYEKFFKQVMTPFKANGRNIELKTPEEALRLMQMGAGYGRKIQDLQPHLKVLRMLEKNELLDEDKLSFLIDLNSKNPEAIKKIIKDSGIDPLDLNMEDNVNYKPNSHSVSDSEMAFQESMKAIQDHPTGNETLRTINQTWDQKSKSALWDQPELLGVIQSQRDNGLYDQIATEIDRQKMLGTIPQSTPFLQAYKLAGDHLQANNGFKIPEGQVTQSQKQPGDTLQKQVLATRTAAPKAQVQNGDKAAAASPTKTNGTSKATAAVNPLQMADDEFMKTFKDRL